MAVFSGSSFAIEEVVGFDGRSSANAPDMPDGPLPVIGKAGTRVRAGPFVREGLGFCRGMRCGCGRLWLRTRVDRDAIEPQVLRVVENDHG
jgi:hypothetical protein